MCFHRKTLLAAILRKICHVLMINFLVIMEKAVCTLGLITLQDQKIKSNNYHFFVCRTFDKHFGFIFVATSELGRKIQYHENRTFLFCLSIYRHIEHVHVGVWLKTNIFDKMTAMRT